MKQKNRKITTCNRLDLETLGSWPITPKNTPWTRAATGWSPFLSTFCSWASGSWRWQWRRWTSFSGWQHYFPAYIRSGETSSCGEFPPIWTSHKTRGVGDWITPDSQLSGSDANKAHTGRCPWFSCRVSPHNLACSAVTRTQHRCFGKSPWRLQQWKPRYMAPTLMQKHIHQNCHIEILLKMGI